MMNIEKHENAFPKYRTAGIYLLEGGEFDV